jgi:hypothetical protein
MAKRILKRKRWFLQKASPGYGFYIQGFNDTVPHAHARQGLRLFSDAGQPV